MPGSQPCPVILSHKQQERLKRLCRRQTSSQRLGGASQNDPVRRRGAVQRGQGCRATHPDHLGGLCIARRFGATGYPLDAQGPAPTDQPDENDRSLALAIPLLIRPAVLGSHLCPYEPCPLEPANGETAAQTQP